MTKAFTPQTQELLDKIRSLVPSETPIHLVGGAVRDMLLGRSNYDMDFVLPEKAIKISRGVAQGLGGAFYPLDEARDTGRVILDDAGKRVILDFARQRGPDIHSDLEKRDFTINAMALSLAEIDNLIDPLGGMQDLREAKMRACSAEAFLDDPARIMRAIRLAVALNFSLIPETRQKLKEAIHELNHLSPERMRDELFRILGGPKPGSALRSLDRLGALGYILPELENLKGLAQSPPHIQDAWEHSIDILSRLSQLLDILTQDHQSETAANWTMGFVSLKLGRFRNEFQAHYESYLNLNRSYRSLVMFAALFHDIGKPETRQETTSGRVQFLEHEGAGARIAARRARQLRLSHREIERLKTIILNHMRPLHLARAQVSPSRRAIYRFFRDTGEAGVDVCLISLADTLGTYGSGLPHETWTQQLLIMRNLLEAYWEHLDSRIAPPPVLRGWDLVQEFNLQPGPIIGQLLDAIRESQAAGEISNRSQALAFASEWLKSHDD